MLYLLIKSYFSIHEGSNIKQKYKGKNQNSDTKLRGAWDFSERIYGADNNLTTVLKYDV